MKQLLFWCLILSSLLPTLNSTLSIATSITLPCPTLSMKHLRNQSTLILCSNLSVILYDPYLSYTTTFAIANNSDVYGVDLSDNDTILTVYAKNSLNAKYLGFYSMADQAFLWQVSGANVVYMHIF